jgi:hypothetical protein
MWRFAVIAVVLVGCGGVVEGGRGGDEPGGAGARTQVPPEDGSEPGTGINPRADTELGACVLGDEATWGEPCAWLADSRCYDTRQMACNCVCPRDRNSSCVSGFASGPEGRVEVACD